MLTDSKVKTATARERAYKLADGRGLTLIVMPNGSKLWRFRYRWQGREKMLSMLTLGKSRWLLETFAYPYIGNEPITDIKARDVLALLRRVDDAGHHETTRRVKQLIGRVFRFAIATERAEYDITAGLRGALTPVVVQNHAGITSPKRIGELLRAIDTYTGEPTK